MQKTGSVSVYFALKRTKNLCETVSMASPWGGVGVFTNFLIQSLVRVSYMLDPNSDFKKYLDPDSVIQDPKLTTMGPIFVT
jgi:hypothetical protein